MSASSSGATSALCSAIVSSNRYGYAIMFSSNALHILNIATKEQHVVTPITIHDNSSDSFLTKRAHVFSDSPEFIAALKKITDVYAGEFSGTITAKGSIFGINLSAEKISTPGDFLCVSFERAQDGVSTYKFGTEISCIGSIRCGGKAFLRRTVTFTADAKPKIFAAENGRSQEIAIRGLQTTSDVSLHGFAHVRLINSAVKNVLFISDIKKTKCAGTVVLEGMSKVTNPDKNATVVRAGSSCLPTIVEA